jgi:hypothetical protein
MIKLDIFIFFVFIVSIIHILNLFYKILKLFINEQPENLSFSFWEKISNYFFISYFITYILQI